MKKRNFTLVELIVVLSTLTVLAGLSMPVILHSRDQATSIACATNLRLLHSAASMYHADWGALPPVGFDPTHTTIEEERDDECATAVILHSAFGSYNAYLPLHEGRGNPDQVYYCPATTVHQESANGSDYGPNCALFRRMNAGKLSKYSNAILFADGYGDYHLMKEYDWIGFRWRHGFDVQSTNVYVPSMGKNADVPGRYGNGSIQAVMVDGSIRSFHYAERETMYENHIDIVPDDRESY